MTERDDQLSGLARVLDRPVAPRGEFADALLERLLEELAKTDRARASHGISWPRRRGLPARVRRPLLAGVLALAVAAIVTAAVVVSRPSPASALDVIREARAAFAHMPPFQATYKVVGVERGARYATKASAAAVAVSYGGPRRLRVQILAEHGLVSDLSPGSYQIYNGHSIGVYDAKGKHFFSSAASGIQPLEFLTWHGTYPNWDRVCRGPDSKVLADAQIAGRDARHIRCGDLNGDVWEVWIDRQTGLLLKVVGEVGGDDFPLGGSISTSAKGGLEIQRLRYNPTFPKRTFSFPPGAFDAAAAQRAILAKLPPFHAVIAVDYGRAQDYVEEAWWQNEHTWRTKLLVDRSRKLSGAFAGAGSFSVQAHGTLDSYNANDKTFRRGSEPVTNLADPAVQLLGVYLDDSEYSPGRCPIVGHALIAGRETNHRRCGPYVVKATAHGKTQGTSGYWIDPATGLALRLRIDGRDVVRVRSVGYRPRFPPGIFRFVPPPGSHNLDKLEQNPYYKTNLAPGTPAPNWHATALAGKPFQLTDLRGKPTLVALLADWCPPCINDFAPLEQAYQHSNGATTVIWVDAQGKVQEAKKLARLNHLTFPGVIDKGAVKKAWAIGSVPEWVLLDPRGRVIEARLGPQTVSQLEQLLARG